MEVNIAIRSFNFSTVSGFTDSINGCHDFADDSTVDSAVGTNPDTLPMTDVVLGRNKETQQLREAFSRISAPGAQSEMILIRGSSGTGKTSLVESSLRNHVTKADGFFADAKFEQVRNNVPFPAFTEVLSDLCDLVSQDETGLPSVQAKIKKAIGEGDELALSMLVSNLSVVTGMSYLGNHHRLACHRHSSILKSQVSFSLEPLLHQNTLSLSS